MAVALSSATAAAAAFDSKLVKCILLLVSAVATLSYPVRWIW